MFQLSTWHLQHSVYPGPKRTEPSTAPKTNHRHKHPASADGEDDGVSTVGDPKQTSDQPAAGGGKEENTSHTHTHPQ